jgi:hypothetical protein
MGIIATAKVIFSADRTGKPSLIRPGNREWVTVVECVGSTSKVVYLKYSPLKLYPFHNLQCLLFSTVL